MRKHKYPKRQRKKKQRKRHKSPYGTSARIAVQEQQAQVDEVRTREFHNQIIKGNRAEPIKLGPFTIPPTKKGGDTE